MDGKCQARAAARQQQVAVGICGTACCIVLIVRVFQCRHSDSQITPSPRDQTRWCVCMYVFGLTMAPDEQHTSWQFKAQESGNDSAGQARVLLNGSGWAVQDVYLPGSSRKLQAQAVSLKSPAEQCGIWHQEATVYVHWICLKLLLPLLFWRHQTVSATHTISACFSIAGAEYIRPFAASNRFSPLFELHVLGVFRITLHRKSIKELCLLEHVGVDWNCLERLLQPCAIQDICDFIPANLSISDVAGISELQQLACLILKLQIWSNDLVHRSHSIGDSWSCYKR